MKPWKVYTLALVILAWSLLYLADRYTHPFDLETERRAARAEGLLNVPPEWTKPPPPESRNALKDWMSFASPDTQKRIAGASMDDLATAIRLGSVAPSDRAAARAFLADQRELVNTVHRAASKPAIYRRHTFAFDEVFPQYAVLRQGVRLLRLRGDLLALDGRYMEAVRENELGLNVARQAAREPLAIPFLVSASTEHLALAGMEDVLILAGPKAPVCEAVRSAVLRTAPERDLVKLITGETVYGVKAMDDIGETQVYRPAPVSPALAARPGPQNPFAMYFTTKPGQAVYLHWMVRYASAVRLPAARRQAAVTTEYARFRDSRNHSPAYVLADALLAIYPRIVELDARALAHRAVVVAAAGVLAHKARTGAYPDRLTPSTAPLPDPYTRKLPGYRREGKGFVVYSAGASGTFTASPTGSFSREAFFEYGVTPRSTPSHTE